MGLKAALLNSVTIETARPAFVRRFWGRLFHVHHVDGNMFNDSDQNVCNDCIPAFV